MFTSSTTLTDRMRKPSLPAQQKVRTTLYLSPAIVVAAILAAQRAGLRLSEWLDRAVAQACVDGATDDEPAAQLPGSDAAAELFAVLAAQAPDALTGRWRILYARVCTEHELWDWPRTTVGQIEDGEAPRPSLNLDRLRRAWPRLLAASFIQ